MADGKSRVCLRLLFTRDFKKAKIVLHVKEDHSATLGRPLELTNSFKAVAHDDIASVLTTSHNASRSSNGEQTTQLIRIARQIRPDPTERRSRRESATSPKPTGSSHQTIRTIQSRRLPSPETQISRPKPRWRSRNPIPIARWRRLWCRWDSSNADEARADTGEFRGVDEDGHG